MNNKLITLNKLILQIYKYQNNFSDKKMMTKLLQNYKGNDFYQYINLQKNNYTRETLLKSDKVEIFLLSWYAGSISKIHDHSHNGCYMKILEGSLEESKYKPKTLDFVEKNIYLKNNISFIDNSHYHKIHNNTIFPAFSLHIYSPPEHKVKFYT